jgi:hypothetical protein
MPIVKLMENSDFNSESLGSVEIMEELEMKKKRLFLRGAVLLFALFFYTPTGILFFRGVAEALFLPGFAIAIMVTFVGLYFLAKSSLWKAYIYGIKILQRLSPPEPTITEAYAVVRIENTFAFILRRGPDGIYFVSFLRPEVTPASKIHVPANFWKWSSALHIEGLRVHDKHGTFSVPTPEGEIVSGEGILLLIPIRGTSYVLHYPNFSRDRLLAVAKYASLLTSTHASVD